MYTWTRVLPSTQHTYTYIVCLGVPKRRGSRRSTALDLVLSPARVRPRLGRVTTPIVQLAQGIAIMVVFGVSAVRRMKMRGGLARSWVAGCLWSVICCLVIGALGRQRYPGKFSETTAKLLLSKQSFLPSLVFLFQCASRNHT